MKKQIVFVLFATVFGCSGVEQEEDPMLGDGTVDERLAALEAIAESQMSQLDELEGDVAALPEPAANHCFWAWESCDPEDTRCIVQCDANDGAFGDTNDYWVAGGGCDLAAGSTMLENRATVVDQPFPEEVSEKAFDAWVCRAVVGGQVQTAYANCCR